MRVLSFLKIAALLLAFSVLFGCEEKPKAPVQKEEPIKEITITSKELADEATKHMAYVEKVVADTIPVIERIAKSPPYSEITIPWHATVMEAIKTLRKEPDLSPLDYCGSILSNDGANMLAHMLGDTRRKPDKKLGQDYQKSYAGTKRKCKQDIDDVLKSDTVKYVLTNSNKNPPSEGCSWATFAERRDGKKQWKCPIE